MELKVYARDPFQEEYYKGLIAETGCVMNNNLIVQACSWKAFAGCM